MSRRESKAPARFQAGAAPPPRIAYQIAAASGKAPPRKEPTPPEDTAKEPAKPLVPTKANAGHKVRIGTRLQCNFVGDGKTAGSVVSKSMGIRPSIDRRTILRCRCIFFTAICPDVLIVAVMLRDRFHDDGGR